MRRRAFRAGDADLQCSRHQAGFSGVPANRSIDQASLGNCHSQGDILGRPLGFRRGHSRRERRERAVVIKHVLCGHGGGLLMRHSVECSVCGYRPFAVLKAIIRDHLRRGCRRRLRECRTAKRKHEPSRKLATQISWMLQSNGAGVGHRRAKHHSAGTLPSTANLTSPKIKARIGRQRGRQLRRPLGFDGTNQVWRLKSGHQASPMVASARTNITPKVKFDQSLVLLPPLPGTP